MSNEKIIVFTSFGSLREVSKEDRLQKGIDLIEKYQMIGFDEQNDCFVPSFEDKSLLFVHENIPEDNADLQKLLQQLDDVDLMILIHRLPHDNIIKLFKAPFIQKGSHSKNAEQHYKLVVDTIIDNLPDKIRRIQMAVFPKAKTAVLLEKKLALLHDCLHPESARYTDLTWLTDGQKNIVTKLVAMDQNLSTPYIKLLTDLRISVLGS